MRLQCLLKLKLHANLQRLNFCRWDQRPGLRWRSNILLLISGEVTWRSWHGVSTGWRAPAFIWATVTLQQGQAPHHHLLIYLRLGLCFLSLGSVHWQQTCLHIWSKVVFNEGYVNSKSMSLQIRNACASFELNFKFQHHDIPDTCCPVLQRY